MDVSGEVQLLVYVQYIGDGEIEILLFCRSLPTKMTSDEIFKCLDNVMSNNSLYCGQRYSVFTDSAAAIKVA